MRDPLSDPRAQDLLTAQPADVAALAGLLRTAATEARSTAGGLRAARDDGVWFGRAANAFRRSIGRLPGELSIVHAGFEDVANALATYEPELARLQASFRRTAGELGDAHARLGPALAAAQADGNAAGPLIALQRTIRGLNGWAFALLDEFAHSRDACLRAIAATAQTTSPRAERGYGVTSVW